MGILCLVWQPSTWGRLKKKAEIFPGGGRCGVEKEVLRAGGAAPFPSPPPPSAHAQWQTPLIALTGNWRWGLSATLGRMVSMAVLLLLKRCGAKSPGLYFANQNYVTSPRPGIFWPCSSTEGHLEAQGHQTFLPVTLELRDLRQLT